MHFMRVVLLEYWFQQLAVNLRRPPDWVFIAAYSSYFDDAR